MNERKPYVKPLGLALCLIPIVLFIVALILSSDVRGYKKMLDSYYSAVQRGDTADFSEFYTSGAPDLDALLVTLSGDENAAYSSKEYKNLLVRHEIKEAQKQGDSVYALTMEVLFSNGDSTNKTSQELKVEKTGGRWKISG